MTVTHYLLLYKTFLEIFIQDVRGNMPDFGRMFLQLKYTDMTQNTYIEVERNTLYLWSSSKSSLVSVKP
jgi:hypothetical protein